MATIAATDATTLPYAQEDTFRVVADLGAYPKWWPPSVQFQMITPGPVAPGTAVRIRSGHFVSWTATVREISPPEKIVFSYSDGAWTGDAAWIVTPQRNGCLVEYAIRLEPATAWIKALGRVVDLAALHSKEMRNVFHRLDRHLASVHDPVP